MQGGRSTPGWRPAGFCALHGTGRGPHRPRISAQTGCRKLAQGRGRGALKSQSTYLDHDELAQDGLVSRGHPQPMRIELDRRAVRRQRWSPHKQPVCHLRKAAPLLALDCLDVFIVSLGVLFLLLVELEGTGRGTEADLNGEDLHDAHASLRGSVLEVCFVHLGLDVTCGLDVIVVRLHSNRPSARSRSGDAKIGDELLPNVRESQVCRRQLVPRLLGGAHGWQFEKRAGGIRGSARSGKIRNGRLIAISDGS